MINTNEQNNSDVVVTVGLFGTCGTSTWREAFIAKYEQLGIDYFNPMVDNWTIDCAVTEAHHLATDDIIVFPVTGETSGFGSLAEIGFAVGQALSGNSYRSVVLYIAPTVDATFAESYPSEAKDSNRARALSIAHLSKVSNGNVHIAYSMEELLEISVELVHIHRALWSIRQH